VRAHDVTSEYDALEIDEKQESKHESKDMNKCKAVKRDYEISEHSFDLF
jgi:hypothetical protein